MGATAASITVRPPRSDDFQSIADLIAPFILGTPIHFGSEVLPASHYRNAFEQDRGRYPWFVGEIDGRFAGFCKSGVWRERDAYRFTAETAIYVADWSRGSGVGRALYTALLDELKVRGFHLAVAGATIPNDASVRFHEALGFKAVGVFRECGFKFDQWHDVAWFEKIL